MSISKLTISNCQKYKDEFGWEDNGWPYSPGCDECNPDKLAWWEIELLEHADAPDPEYPATVTIHFENGQSVEVVGIREDSLKFENGTLTGESPEVRNPRFFYFPNVLYWTTVL